MVTRKPVAPPLTTSNPPKQTGNPLPYPTTPTDSAKTTASTNSIYSPDLSNSPAFDLIDMKEAQQRARSDSDSSHGTWNSDSDDEAEVPKPLNVRASQIMGADSGDKGKTKETPDRLPSILRPGGGKARQTSPSQQYTEEAQANPWAEQTRQDAKPAYGYTESHNPYLRQNVSVEDNSQSEWQDVKPPPAPTAAPPPAPAAAPPPPPVPVELPTMKTPSDELSQMSLGDRRPASWETAEILSVPQKGQSPLPPVTEHQESEQWQQERPVSTWWQDAQPAQYTPQASPAVSPPTPPAKPLEAQYAPPPGPPPQRQQQSLLDHQDELPSYKANRPTPAPITTAQPSRSTDQVPETPGTALKRQRNEHYQIKHINWIDASSRNLRHSSVLTQNANGPCPLLALVNALVLSTPSNLDTALVETLRTREQVSLGLLLDAVFDELTSGRRSDPAHELPDVSELYSFLLALHTGMNVNPRFVTPIETPRGSLDGRPPDFGSIHPMHRAQSKPGAFEETREMRMYSTFNIPLIHGWTTPVETPAYEAFVRSAPTFEDAQNIQFAESELEDKLRSQGLPPQEQQTLQDIQTIKSFLNTWPTQLTDFGLETISKNLKPGQIAILFRNDHFSTIYKEPKYGALMTLVTDTGYSSHAEIIWESLVDVSGAASEMFSGDFRVVSHNQDQNARLNQGNSGGGEEGWQTVQSRTRYRNSPSRTSNPPPLPGPRPPQVPASIPGPAPVAADLGVQDEAQRKASEQEDHDLALALQLQEEEEDRERQAQDRRRREQALSEQFLSNETEGPRPPIPPRRSGGRSGNAPTTTPSGRAPVNRPADNNPSDPEAPPTYEQAWSDQPYRPGGSSATGTMAQGNPLGAYDALRRQQSAYASTATSTPNQQQSPPYARDGRRQSSYNNNNANAGRNRRRSSAVGGVPGAYGSSSQVGGPGPGGPGGQPGRVGQAAGVKDAEERCVVM